jgi:hypothetical protein
VSVSARILGARRRRLAPFPNGFKRAKKRVSHGNSRSKAGQQLSRRH